MGFNPFKKKDWDRLGKKAKKGATQLDFTDDIAKAFSEIERVGSKVGELDGVVDEIQKARRWAGGRINEIDKTLENLPDAIETTARRVVLNLAEHAVEEGLKVAADTARKAHKGMARFRDQRPDLVDAIDQLGFEVEIKAVVSFTLEYDGFYERAEETAGILDRFGHDGFEFTRSNVRGFITAMGPSSISFGGELEFSLGATAGGAIRLKAIPLTLAVELIDLALDELGVPE